MPSHRRQLKPADFDNALVPAPDMEDELLAEVRREIERDDIVPRRLPPLTQQLRMLPNIKCRGLVRELVGIMYWDEEARAFSTDKEWNSDTLEAINDLLLRYRVVPDVTPT